MRTPLNTMIIRRADLDAIIKIPGVTAPLNSVASPLGGTFGKVRSGGHKHHSGWDLYAKPGTPCFNVGGSQFELTKNSATYGQMLVLKLLFPEAMALANRKGVSHIYAVYSHLQSVSAPRASLMEGVEVARTGVSGNAGNTPPHLHFELRTSIKTITSADGFAFDPGELFGSSYFASRVDDERSVKTMFGL